jgi:hypothetical protein
MVYMADGYLQIRNNNIWIYCIGSDANLSSGGTCTLLPSFLGVHPNFWGCNLLTLNLEVQRKLTAFSPHKVNASQVFEWLATIVHLHILLIPSPTKLQRNIVTLPRMLILEWSQGCYRVKIRLWPWPFTYDLENR